jgi:hypothetical protein
LPPPSDAPLAPALVMNLDRIGQAALIIDIAAIGAVLVYAWLDLRRQPSDIGKVGGVVALMALCFVFYFAGRALLGV